MRPHLSITFLVAISLISAQGQQLDSTQNEFESCSALRAETLFPLQLKLGMTADEASAILGREIRPSEVASRIRFTTTSASGFTKQFEAFTQGSIGESEFQYYPRKDNDLGSLNLKFWHRRLYSFALIFDERDFEWEAGSPDSDPVAKRLGFSRVGWKDGRMQCTDYYIAIVRSGGIVNVEITDLIAKDEILKKAKEVIQVDPEKPSVQFKLRTYPDVKPVLRRRDSDPPPILQKPAKSVDGGNADKPDQRQK